MRAFLKAFVLVAVLAACAQAQSGTGTIKTVTVPAKGGQPTMTLLMDTTVTTKARETLKGMIGSHVTVSLSGGVIVAPPKDTATHVTPPPKDTAIVVVPPPVVTKPDSTPPVVVAPSGICANEPRGATRFEDQAWNTSLPKGWIDDSRTGWAKRGSIVQDASAPLSPSNVVAGQLPAGSPGGSATFYIYRPFASSEQYKTIYICAVMKFSSDFDNTNGNAGTKVFWPAGDQVQGASTYVTLNAATMDLGVNLQGAPAEPNNREMYANLGKSGSLLAKRGKWVVLEFLMRGSSGETKRDGGLDIWIDGVQTHHYTDVGYSMQWRGNPTNRTWLSFAWNPTYGGGLNPVPHDQFEYIDHLRLSGIR